MILQLFVRGSVLLRVSGEEVSSIFSSTTKTKQRKNDISICHLPLLPHHLSPSHFIIINITTNNDNDNDNNNNRFLDIQRLNPSIHVTRKTPSQSIAGQKHCSAQYCRQHRPDLPQVCCTTSRQIAAAWSG
jgi:hypothetical protein